MAGASSKVESEKTYHWLVIQRLGESVHACFVVDLSQACIAKVNTGCLVTEQACRPGNEDSK